MNYMRFLFISLVFCIVFGSFAYAQDDKSTIIHLKIHGSINPATQSYIERGLRKAKDVKAAAVLIELNTPGGLLTATRRIVEALFDSDVPVIVYVSPSGAHAGSAGVMITLASHVAAMAPGTNIGAAHPVSGQGQDIEGAMAEKVTNDTVAWVESIAKTRGRNVKWAGEAVKKSVSIDNENALKLKVIEYVSPSVPALLKAIHNTKIKMKENKIHTLNTLNAVLAPLEFTTKENVIDTLSDPNIAYILMMIGMVGIYIELSHPGAIFPGVLGAICIILSFICFQALPITTGGMVLLLLGLTLLIAEIFVPSFGILGIGGIISLFLGSLFLIDPTATDITISLGVIFPTILTVGGIMLFIAVYVMRAYRKKAAIGVESFIGKEGKIIYDIDPGKEGKILVDGDYWNAVSKEPLKKGEKVIIEKIDGMILTVRRK